MIRSSMCSMSKTVCVLATSVIAVCAIFQLGARGVAWGEAIEREPMTLRVVAVNPSADKSRTIPVRIDLPQEVKPSDILDHGDLEVEFDTDRSLYYVHKDDVTLAPKQTRVFEVLVRDVWFITDPTLDSLRSHTQLLLRRLEKSEYYESAKQLADSITTRLDDIQKMQVDETIGRKQRIGNYRRNLQALETIKEDLARMEKLLAFSGGPPVPEMMKESPLKSDAPSTTTTWLVIFLIMIFMGLLAGQFFFTWQRRAKSTAEFGGLGQTPTTAPGGSQPGANVEPPSR